MTLAETTMGCSSSAHRCSSRVTRLTAGPMTVKSSRSAAPMLPYMTLPTWIATPHWSGLSPAAWRRSLSAATPASASSAAVIAASQASHTAALASGQGKIASMASPMNLRISPPWPTTGSAMRSK